MLLSLHDAEFVAAGYRTLLKREPDGSGFPHYLELLRSGALNKIEILGRLRYSDEGNSCSVRIPGLSRAYFGARLFRLPVIGYLLSLLNALIRLPALVQNLSRLENFTLTRLNDLQLLEESEKAHTLIAFTEQRRALDELHRVLTRMAYTKAERTELTDINSRLESLHSIAESPARLNPQTDTITAEHRTFSSGMNHRDS